MTTLFSIIHTCSNLDWRDPHKQCIDCRPKTDLPMQGKASDKWPYGNRKDQHASIQEAWVTM